MAGVTPKQIYTALLNAGASTNQAIGVMANAINESSLDPEAINRQDPNGGSYGFVQQNGSQYASLVTGNPPADLTAQVKVLAQNGGFKAASGSTPAQAAGNFSANYERCQGCQPGGAQYNSRVANAATVAGWVTSGHWPTSAGNPASGGGGGGTQATLTSYDPSTCLLGSSGLFGVGSFCLFKRSEARAIIGGMVLLVSASIGIAGAVILAASAFQRTGALSKAADAAAVVPGGGAVAEGLTVAHRRATRSGAGVASERRGARVTAQRQAARQQRTAETEARRQQRREDAAARRAAGSQASQRRAVKGQAPRRPQPATRPRPPREEHH